MTDPFATSDAAYVLGALRSDERDAYERHLQECRECARAVRGLSGLPQLLAQAKSDLAPMEPPPPSLLPAMLKRVRKSRRRRLFTFGGIAAAAVAAAAALAIVLLLVPVLREDAVPMAQVAPFPVQATMQLAEAPTGLRVDMSCSYGGSKARGYLLVAVGQDGAVEQLASWRAVPGDTVEISVATDLRRGEVSALEVRTPTGTPVLRLSP